MDEKPKSGSARAPGEAPGLLTNELSCVTLRKVDPSKNMARQYSVAVCRDLFGTPVVVCRWGRIGRVGRSTQHVCASLEEAQALAEELVRKRRRRGYGETESGGAYATQATAERWRDTHGPTKTQECESPEAALGLAGKPVAKGRRIGYRGGKGEGSPTTPAATPPAKGPAPHRRPRSTGKAALQTTQLSLFGWKAPMPAAQATEPQLHPAIAAQETGVVPLMRQLGKPATHAERERALSILTLAASLRGIPMSRGGRQVPAPA